VRYRYDAQQRKRFKTVELIVSEREWDPPAPRFAADAMVGVRVGFAEVEVREQVKQAGGRWNRSRKVWELRRYDEDFPLPSVLLNGRTAANRPLHVVVGSNVDEQQLVIITTYEPDALQWADNFSRRII